MRKLSCARQKKISCLSLALNEMSRLILTNLGGQVAADKSKFILKKNYVILKLIKPTAQTWGNLIYKKKFDPLKKMDKKEDPQIGMMKMMQRMTR